MNVEAYDVDSLRKMVRILEYENRLLKDKLKKASIPYDEVNPFEEKIENAEEYDPDQGERIVNPSFISEEMAIRFFSMFWGREDVYARRGKNGGYFPQCDNRWNDRLCPKQRKEKVFCDECENTKWTRLDVKKIIAHLLGFKEDVAMVGSMYSRGKFNERINSYGMVIMDECHHAASNTSMELLQKINAKYVYGVSATPKRGDSLDRIIYMLLGPLRHRFTALERAQEQGIGHYFVPRYTRVVDNAESKDDINKAYSLISTSRVRNEMIVNDVLTCVARKQTPVILTKFKEHAKFLYDALKGKADHVFLLYGDNSDKENAEIRVRLKQVPENETLILVATGQKIGEGFDFPRLDVLMLAAPVSFEGRLEQYVGRLNRDYPGKEAVYVYDYIDSHVRFFDKMYAKRLRTYKKTGFSIWTGELQSKQMINAIFDSGNYTEKFEQDIVEAEKMVVISSPDIRQDKIERFLFLMKGRQEAGVKVTIITTDPEEIVYGSSDVCHELIRTMQLVGMNVVTKTEVEERFAVIDDELVWHGGMNLLGKVDVWDNLMRIRNHQVAAELLEIALGYLSEK